MHSINKSSQMAIKESRELRRLSHSDVSPHLHLNVYGRSYTLDKKVMLSRSGKLLSLLNENQNHHQQPYYTLPDMPGTYETFELALRFCYGLEVNLSSDNVIPLICLAHYLGMTSKHAPDDLLGTAINFFNHQVLPIWSEALKALHAAKPVMKEAMKLGIVGVCLDSIVQKACADPHLLGEPTVKPGYNKVSAKRRLFLFDHYQSEDLTMLSLPVFELLVSKLIQVGIGPEYVAALLYRYTKKWIHLDEEGTLDPLSNGDDVHKREIIEVVEKLFPNQIGVLPCKLLLQMLRTAIVLDAGSICKYGFEDRIGKQLSEATAEELLIPFQGYAREVRYDTESVKRILKAFYGNYMSQDQSGLIKVADLIDEFLAEVAMEPDLEKDTFISLLKLSTAASADLNRSADGMYLAIDVYLDKHTHLTQSEKEEVCQLLDCHRMSTKACAHAAQNERLPLRLVVQTLFVGQLQLRHALSNRIGDSEIASRKEEMEVSGDDNDDDDDDDVGDETKLEMEKIDNRVIELEKECLLMKKNMEKGNGLKEKKQGVWKKLKRKFGCISSMSSCDCQVKKKVHSSSCF